jgi:NADH-quinone oxidoreductase subunit F
VAEAYERGYLGERILDSDHSFDLVVHRGQGAYICGEESALLDALEGKRGNPRLKPPFPANQGLYQGPTLINNVETLCNAPLIIERGGEWFASLGEGKSTGTKIVSVSGNVQRPGNYEVELGVSGRELVFGLAGGPPPGHEVKCWFPGGSSAPVLLDEHLDLPYTFEAMAEAGSMLGSGAIIVVDDSVPIVSVALRLAEFYRHESCGKCVPCREGTNWTVKTLERIDDGDATPMDLEIMAQVQENIIGNCLCVLGDSMAMPVGSMIKYFREEFEQHIAAARARKEREEMAAFSAAELAASAEAGPA